MTEFKFTIAIIAIITLILLLTIVGVSLSSNETKIDWPPMQTKCPELYTLSTTSGEENTCHVANGYSDYGTDTTSIGATTVGGTQQCNSVNTAHADFTGIGGDCNKHKWAVDCGVSWDGIYDNPSLCDSSSS